MPLPTGKVLHNRYRIVKLLGQGGFGAVYRAWDMHLNTACAVKENFETSDEAQRQFHREATVLSQLRHVNLPGVRDHFFVPGQGQYLVMDFIEGENLQEMMERTRKPIPEKQAIKWIGQICDAVEYLHSQRPPIIHRDIKPDNIRITPAGKAVLVDFGLVKVYAPNTTTTKGARALTPGYAPHEQYGNGRTDERTDVYALGATLYTLLTGQPPAESIQRIPVDHLTPVRQLNSKISHQTAAAVHQALQIAPDQRFQTAAAFKNALQGQPPRRLPARQPSAPPKPAKKSGKAAMLSAGGIFIILAILAGLCMFSGASIDNSGEISAASNNSESPLHLSSGQTTDNDETVINFPTKTRTPKPPPTSSPENCPGAPPIRVKIGDHVTVCVKAGTVYFREEPNANADHLYKLIPGAELDIIGGPVCDPRKGWWYWQARTESGTLGWIAEGGDEIDPYFICP